MYVPKLLDRNNIVKRMCDMGILLGVCVCGSDRKCTESETRAPGASVKAE